MKHEILENCDSCTHFPANVFVGFPSSYCYSTFLFFLMVFLDYFVFDRLIEAKAIVFECGPKCGCGPDCINRTSQQGMKYRLEVSELSWSNSNCVVLSFLACISIHLTRPIHACILTGVSYSKEGVGCQVLGFYTFWCSRL